MGEMVMVTTAPDTPLTDEQAMAIADHPVAKVLWVPIEKVRANAWNPNKVAPVEMHLLYVSIKADGFTQPIVTIRDDEHDVWIVVDGFHRYSILRTHKDVAESTGGLAPIVVISGDSNALKASTIRHNRARGKHGIQNMAQIVFDMLDNGWDEAEVCAELGMSADEIVRLKHVTGFSKLFDDVEYRRAWETKRMAHLRREYTAANPGEAMP